MENAKRSTESKLRMSDVGVKLNGMKSVSALVPKMKDWSVAGLSA